MNRKVLFILKLLVGVYLIFVGVTLLRTILEMRPGNQEIMSGVAAMYILVGAGYLIGLLVSGIKSSIKVQNISYPDEIDQSFAVRPARDQSLFRTAPMHMLKEEHDGFRPGEEEHRERKQEGQTSRISSSTVTLQKVGPDTMVWENKEK